MTFLISFLLVSFASSAQEICDNGIDDDGNGLIDLNDPGCQCHYQADTNLLLNPSFESYQHCMLPPYDYAHNFDIPKPWQYAVIEDGGLYYYGNFSCTTDSANWVFWHPTIYPQDGKGFIGLGENGFPSNPESHSRKEYIAQVLKTPLLKGVSS